MLGSLLALSARRRCSARRRRCNGCSLTSTPRPVSLTATLGSALLTNLATVALLAPVAVTHTLTRALVTGVDLGVGLTPIGSLATVLWRDAARRKGEPVPMRDYLVIGIPLSLVLVVVGTAMA